jgi:outer membrane protein OmpA-like peptidoglycan-associated protein/tetratricopeptide (TPR) repeat protein
MKFRTRILLIFCLFSLAFAYGQNKLVEKGDTSYANLAYADAIIYYTQAIEEGAVSTDVYRKLGDSYYFNADLEKANQIYTLLFEKERPNDPEYLFRFSQTLKAVKKYDQSDAIMNEFLVKNNTDSRSSLYAGSRNYLDSIKTNMFLYDVENLKLNSSESDFAPAMLGTELVFSSARDAKRLSRFQSKWNNEAFLDIFITKDFQDPDNTKADPLGKKINSKFHESTTVFTKDGNTMYFTRNDFSSGKRGADRTRTTRLKIFKSVRKGNSWGKPTELPFNSKDYSVAHPALSADEKTLYFASDMPGTFGASDLWMVSIRSNGTYGNPVNLGNRVNTEAKETFPYVSASNNLYFASDGHVGLGGLDIFVSKINEGNSFGEVINVGKPVNGPTDDFTFVINEEKRVGYFASNRKGGKGSDDIYVFKLRPNEVKVFEQLVMGLITDADTNEKLVGAKVSLLNNDTDTSKIRDTIADALGIYEINAIRVKDSPVENIVKAEFEGYQPAQEKFTRTKEIDTFYVNLQLRKIQDPQVAPDPVTDVVDTTPVVKQEPVIGSDLAKVLQLKPIYFDFDKAKIRYDAKIELDKVVRIMKQHPEIVIDVRSHTDSRGRDNYNLSLSDKRAKATVSYLLNKGIAANRISGKGYGEDDIINGCTNGVRCTIHQHQLNRRSEFVVVKNAAGGSIVVKSSDIIDPSEFVTGRPGSNSGEFIDYDFSPTNTTVVYTVQIGALRGNVQSKQFNRLTNLFNHRYNDGFNRYFSGMFSTPAEARNYMRRLRDRGYEGAFIVGLKGEIRF